ncbi:MAG: phage major tail protein, TP901-1 family [Sporolactobacillus sp.]
MTLQTQTPISGKQKIFLFQSQDAAIGSDALFPGFQTDGTWTIEGDLADEQTKNGRVLGYAQHEESGDVDLYLSEDDDGQSLLEDARKNQKILKCWNVELIKNANGKYNARFAYILIESYEEKQASDGFVEVSIKFQVIGKSQDGEIDLDDEFVEMAQYAFETPGETGSIAVTGLTVAPTTASIIIGATQQLTPTVSPADATDKTVSYVSSNPAIATVSGSGLVTAVAAGTATITVKSNAVPTETATSAITVTES